MNKQTEHRKKTLLIGLMPYTVDKGCYPILLCKYLRDTVRNSRDEREKRSFIPILVYLLLNRKLKCSS